ncbi:protein FAM187B-like [Scyliorhinus canicula]|uniref:protein FAM187B-like n=1 Tax=Scyliorhinus canicula TaxID=7830 RepID=UPI0018F6BDDC|nr:protein FAM187B-like [Scyliorhinus canicula]
MLMLLPALSILALLMDKLLPVPGGQDASCLPPQACQIPLLSRNVATLVCVVGPVSEGPVAWFYVNSSDAEGRAQLLLGDGSQGAPSPQLQLLRSRSEVKDGNLIISPLALSDSGIYSCRAADKTLAYYEVDVQDVDSVHVSDRWLGQTVLPRLRVQLGRRSLQMFTLWNSWQECDRCSARGQRKRLGYCYAQAAGAPGPPLPCGLQALREGRRLPRRGPELALASCHVPCATGPSPDDQLRRLELPGRRFVLLDQAPVLLLETHLVTVHSNVTFRCPGASIYSPVSWQWNSTQVGGLESPQEAADTHSLDPATGGSVYTITDTQLADQGLYRCFVSERLAASFHLRVFNPFRTHRGVGGSAMGFIWTTLACVGLASLILILLTLLYTYCSQIRRHQKVTGSWL